MKFPWILIIILKTEMEFMSDKECPVPFLSKNKKLKQTNSVWLYFNTINAYKYS